MDMYAFNNVYRKSKHDKLQNKPKITQTEKNIYLICFIFLVGGATLVTFLYHYAFYLTLKDIVLSEAYF